MGRRIYSLMLSLLGLGACSGIKSVDATEFEKAIKDPAVQLVDVRTPKEYAESRIPGAINIDVKDEGFLEKAKSSLDAAKTVAVYCRSGKRSMTAAKALSKEGFRIVNLKGGIMGWQESGKAVDDARIYEVDEFRTPDGKKVAVSALMHASMRIQWGDVEIQVDPVSKMGERSVDYSKMPKADYILVTHEHGDHFDPEAIRTLSKEGTVLVTNEVCAGKLGFGKVLSNGETLPLGNGLVVDAVPAYNYTEGHTSYHPKGRDNGYVLSLGGMRIYIAGDTEDIPEMSEVRGIDVAFLPCNQPYTMTVQQMLKAARTIHPKVLFPYHYSETDLSAVPSEIDGTKVRIREDYR